MRGTALLVGSLLAGLVLGSISGAAVARNADGPAPAPAVTTSQPADPTCPAPAKPATGSPQPSPGPTLMPAPRSA
ncbi:hypothetical protein [Streptomyces sp. LS1784]|uniref:hypothetical protein n=1 Tax=Streptomyces sp. LS1784 TaxID=2851533 RepID=UPI001CCDB4B2|nr:hypothetical protein [Streptomyces sp. LS1784]